MAHGPMEGPYDMLPIIGDTMYDVQLYVAFHSTLARSQAPGALRTTHILLKTGHDRNYKTVKKYYRFSL